MPKIGLFGARSTNSGLGVQSHEFYRVLNPLATVVVDFFYMDQKAVFPSRFSGPGVTTVKGVPKNQFVDQWLDEVQPSVVFCMETPYNYYLFDACRQRKIPTVLQYNFEWLDYTLNPALTLPDVLLAPSSWNIDLVQERYGKLCQVKFMPVPVNTDVMPGRKITQCKHFIHVAGYQLYQDRNGTEAVLDAIPHLRHDINVTIYSQHKLAAPKDPRVKIVNHNWDNYWDLYHDGDCLLLPRRYGGLCLPTNEAMAAGMLVVMPECPPNIGYIHPMCLFEVDHMVTVEARCGPFKKALFHPEVLAEKMNQLASFRPEVIQRLADDNFARAASWDSYKDVYLEFLSSVKVHERFSEPINGKVRCRCLTTFDEAGKFYTKDTEEWFEIPRARALQAKHKVVVL